MYRPLLIIRVLIVLLALLGSGMLIAQDQPATEQPVAANAPASELAVQDELTVDYAKMTLEQQEAYKTRVKTEVSASVIILTVFIFFVVVVSTFRFGRSYSHYLKLKKKKKTEYVDIWGNPRVQIDDLPTDDEMLGKESYE